MANLTNAERLKFENLFEMGTGYVIDFSHTSLRRFILNSINVDIEQPKYNALGTSKANRLRSVWDNENEIKVGKLNEELLIHLKTHKENNDDVKPLNNNLYNECLNITFRLQGKKFEKIKKPETVEDFLQKDVDEVAVGNLKIDGPVIAILEERIVEVKKNLNAGTSLSVIFLCGSILEGILLGIASKNMREFNQSPLSPKDKNSGSVKQFQDWSLSNFIDVAHDLGWLGLDVKKYSHSLRDFRNYIHPYLQMSSGFSPDMHTAKISWQVLKAAIFDIHEKGK